MAYADAIVIITVRARKGENLDTSLKFSHESEVESKVAGVAWALEHPLWKRLRKTWRKERLQKWWRYARKHPLPAEESNRGETEGPEGHGRAGETSASSHIRANAKRAWSNNPIRGQRTPNRIFFFFLSSLFWRCTGEAFEIPRYQWVKSKRMWKCMPCKQHRNPEGLGV